VGIVHKRSSCGFTLIEVILALTILSVGMLTLYITLSRALLLTETNKQIKIALFQAQSIVEEIIGVPFDQIMDPDYPNAATPNPRYRHMQYVEDYRLYGGTKIKPNLPRLTNEKVLVWYGSQVDTSNVTVPGNLNPVVINTSGTITVQHAILTPVAHPLNIVPGSDKVATLAPPPSPEQCRPASNSPDGSQFATPEPLFVTVQVTWTGPTGQPMVQRLTVVRSR